MANTVSAQEKKDGSWVVPRASFWEMYRPMVNRPLPVQSDPPPWKGQVYFRYLWRGGEEAVPKEPLWGRTSFINKGDDQGIYFYGPSAAVELQYSYTESPLINR